MMGRCATFNTCSTGLANCGTRGTRTKLQEFMQQNPNMSRQDIIKKVISVRGSIREDVVKFLTPQQLQKWDTEMAKAKEFLGHRIAA
jgi:hypothetical protein